MVERRRLVMMGQLLAVQRARRSGAEIVLAEAREVEANARAAEQSAIQARDEALQDWTRCVGEAGFSPEHSRALSSHLIARDGETQSAGVRAEAATQIALSREQEWRTLEAQVRAGDRTRIRLVRKLARRSEEKRLEALADRVTGSWRPS